MAGYWATCCTVKPVSRRHPQLPTPESAYQKWLSKKVRNSSWLYIRGCQPSSTGCPLNMGSASYRFLRCHHSDMIKCSYFRKREIILLKLRRSLIWVTFYSNKLNVRSFIVLFSHTGRWLYSSVYCDRLCYDFHNSMGFPVFTKNRLVKKTLSFFILHWRNLWPTSLYQILCQSGRVKQASIFTS